MKKCPVVSVGIPTYGRTKVFEDTLRSILSQSYPEDLIEIIVVDNNPKDTLRKIIQKFSDHKVTIKYLHRPRSSISTNRCEICRVAKGDVLVKLDDDFLLRPDFINKLVKKLTNGYDIVAYRILDPCLKGRSNLGPNSTLIPVLHHENAELFTGYAFWRHMTNNLFFDTYFLVGYEDIDFWVTAKERGFKTAVEYGAVAYHQGKTSAISSRFGQSYHPRITRERLYFNFKHNHPVGIRSWISFLIWEARLLLRDIKNTIFQRSQLFPLLAGAFLFERIRMTKTYIDSVHRKNIKAQPRTEYYLFTPFRNLLGHLRKLPTRICNCLADAFRDPWFFLYVFSPRLLVYIVQIMQLQTIIVRTEVGKMVIPTDRLISGMFIASSRYELDVRKHLQIKKGDVVVDVGCHWGEYVLRMAQNVGPEGLVIGIEAHPANYNIFLSNLRLNRIQNVIPLQMAVTDSRGQATLFLSRDNSKHSLIRQYGFGGMEVRTDTLDNVIHDLKLGPIDCIKIDVEGAELNALQGCRNLLSKSPPSIILVECHTEQSIYDICKYLSKVGYRCARMTSGSTENVRRYVYARKV